MRIWLITTVKNWYSNPNLLREGILKSLPDIFIGGNILILNADTKWNGFSCALSGYFGQGEDISWNY